MTVGDLVEVRIPDDRPGFAPMRTVLGRLVTFEPDRPGIPAHATIRVGTFPLFARWPHEIAPAQEEDDAA